MPDCGTISPGLCSCTTVILRIELIFETERNRAGFRAGLFLREPLKPQALPPCPHPGFKHAIVDGHRAQPPPDQRGGYGMIRRSPPRKISYFEPVAPRLARNTVIEST